MASWFEAGRAEEAGCSRFLELEPVVQTHISNLL